MNTAAALDYLEGDQTEAAAEVVEFRLQAGKQEMFGACNADIAIYGGGAGSGKTYAELMEPLRYLETPGFVCVIFRRTFPEIMNPGGLWDGASDIYPHFGAKAHVSEKEWRFPSGMRVKFAHMEHEQSKHNWQGAQIPLIQFDELTHFSAGMFFYMMSRNRLDRALPMRPYMRATCNPSHASWVRDLIAWWLDPRTGLPIQERGGVVRWFIRKDSKLLWADTPEQLVALVPGALPRSFTFIPALITDNPALMENNPDYLSNLDALPMFERDQLRNGNWNTRPVAGMRFKREWFRIIEKGSVPDDQIVATVRYWDRASTEPNEKNPNPDWTAGTRMSKTRAGRFIVERVDRFQARPAAVRANLITLAVGDKSVRPGVALWLERDPASAGTAERDDLAAALAEFGPRFAKPDSSKWERSGPFSAAAENGLVDIVRGKWNADWLDELENFSDPDLDLQEGEESAGHDDQVDSTSGAYNRLAKQSTPRIS